MLRDRAGWGGGWGGVHYRSWNVDHVVDAPCSICLVAGDAQVVPGGYRCIHMYIYILLKDMVITEIINAYFEPRFFSR